MQSVSAIKKVIFGFFILATSTCQSFSLITGLQALGTLFCLGIPVVPFVGVTVQTAIQGPFTEIGRRYGVQTRSPTVQEDAFLRQFIPPNIHIYIAENWECSCASYNLVVIGERIPGYEITMQEALEMQDENALKAFAVAAQHEYGHVKNHHVLKSSLFASGIPIAVTAFTAYFANKFDSTLFVPDASYDFNTAMSMFNWKLSGAVMLLLINYFLVYKGMKHVHHAMEFEADQNVSVQDKPFLIKLLTDMCTKYQRSLDQEYDTHPSAAARIKFLESK